MKTHHLKTLPEFFEAIDNGDKTFEVRKNDRGFMVGDYLTLEEWTEDAGYTGREIYLSVTYILHGPAFGIEAGHCVMAVSWEGMKA